MPSLRAIALVAVILAAAPAEAKPVQKFSIAALKAAQAKGEPVLVDAFAPWCPVCRAQAPTIDALATDPAYARLRILRLDYDAQTAEKKALGITKQSTLIVYRGSKEVGRSVGITSAEQIKTFAGTALR